MNCDKKTKMDNKLIKLLEKTQKQLFYIINSLLNVDDELLDKVYDENDNGEFFEDKNHWNNLLLEIDKLKKLVHKLDSKALAITDESEIQILNRFLIDDFQNDYEILSDIEERHLGSDDPRTKCLKETVFFQTYIWEIIDRTEKQLGINSDLPHIPLKQLKANLIDKQIDKLFELLIDNGYISGANDKNSFKWAFGDIDEPEKFTLIRWIKPNSRTKGKSLNKLSLLNLLRILKVPESQILNRPFLNSIFAKPDGKSIKFTSSNYPSKGYTSEYNQQLTEIVSKVL